MSACKADISGAAGLEISRPWESKHKDGCTVGACYTGGGWTASGQGKWEAALCFPLCTMMAAALIYVKCWHMWYVTWTVQWLGKAGSRWQGCWDVTTSATAKDAEVSLLLLLAGMLRCYCFCYWQECWGVTASASGRNAEVLLLLLLAGMLRCYCFCFW